MPCSASGTNLFIAVVTFAIGVAAVSVGSRQQAAVETLDNTTVETEKTNCTWVSYDRWKQIDAIRGEIMEIEDEIERLRKPEEKAVKTQRLIRLRMKLWELKKDGPHDSEHNSGRSSPYDLVIREVCEEN